MDYALGVAALGAVQANMEHILPYLPQWANGLLTMGVAVGIVIFRHLTTGPMR